MSAKLLDVRLHYIYCVYGDSNGPLEEVRDLFSLDIGKDVNVYNATKLAFCPYDRKEYVKFFDDDSPFALWNKSFKIESSEFGYHGNIYDFGVNYYDALLSAEELKEIEYRLEKRKNELCSTTFERESSDGDMKVCRRCGANFKSGEGFEIEGLDLCLDCLMAVRKKLSADSAEPETGRCECDCKNEKCDCEKCECDSECDCECNCEKVTWSDDEAVEESE